MYLTKDPQPPLHHLTPTVRKESVRVITVKKQITSLHSAMKSGNLCCLCLILYFIFENTNWNHRKSHKVTMDKDGLIRGQELHTLWPQVISLMMCPSASAICILQQHFVHYSILSNNKLKKYFLYILLNWTLRPITQYLDGLFTPRFYTYFS